MLERNDCLEQNIYKRSDQSRTAYAGSTFTQYAERKGKIVCDDCGSQVDKERELPTTCQCLLLQGMSDFGRVRSDQELYYFPGRFFLKSGTQVQGQLTAAQDKFLRDS